MRQVSEERQRVQRRNSPRYCPVTVIRVTYYVTEGHSLFLQNCLLSTVTVTPSDWDYVNRSAVQVPTGILLSFYYKDIKQEIVHALLLDEYVF